jgi:DNA-binding MarR family transcriptional regulator
VSGRAGRQRGAHRFAYGGLDRVIHERARLSVLTSLLTHPRGLPFGDLKVLCALTDGNLSRHLQVLEGARLVIISKSSENNRPQTVCRISPTGRKRYLEYLAVLEQVIVDAATAVKTESAVKPGSGQSRLHGVGEA